ncbi:cache domain-containing protein [Hasllibacter halocynthiae]|uniref:cache domain-containing protein n=1 Tax=Hasllibacter halocynthiae TaxID=595589 RepID=UPI000D07BC1A
MPRPFPGLRLGYAGKLALAAALPLALAVGGIGWLVLQQSRTAAAREIAALEDQLTAAKREELRNYAALARGAISAIHGPAAFDDEDAKARALQILSAMTYGRDGYFFVFDYDGTALAAPRRTELIGRRWHDLTDTEGTSVTAQLIDLAREGGGYHSFLWQRPSTGEEGRVISYVIGLQDWRWAIGTGIFVDDILAAAAAARTEAQARVRETFLWIGAIAALALGAVFATGLALAMRERRRAEAARRALTGRIVDAQEEERTRVARELHDSISQMLVGVRYALDLARRRLDRGDPRAAGSLRDGIAGLGRATQEVRRISRDLRPGALDDLGLGPALKSLLEEFGARTGTQVAFETVVFRNRLSEEARVALYRIAQEALTNIERHSGARRVAMKLHGTRRGAVLRIEDDGRGLAAARSAEGRATGLGLRNMRERAERLGGTLAAGSRGRGTTVEAVLPLRHILPAAAPSAEGLPVAAE